MGYIHLFINFVLHLNQYLAILVAQYGPWVYMLLFLIIFCETGIVVAACLPGDSLLFAAGALAAAGALNITLLMLLLITAAFVGNTINYWVGNKIGHLLFRNENSIIFRKSHLDKTHAFYEKHGGKTIIIGSFIPIIRTFAPFVAGMSDMNHVKFMIVNLFGSIFWMTIVLFGSYLFGNIPVVKNNFTFVVLAIIAISVLPPFIEYARHKIKRLRKAPTI